MIRLPDFLTWRALVEFEILEATGLRLYDLPDQPYRDWYDDEISPDVAARLIIDREEIQEL